MKTYRIACIPGDGIGKEVIPAGQQVLSTLAHAQGRFAFEFTSFAWGGDWYRAHGEMMPADGLDALRGMDAILFGSAGDPHIPDHITLWGLRLKICQGFDQYANVRPTRILPGLDALRIREVLLLLQPLQLELRKQALRVPLQAVKVYSKVLRMMTCGIPFILRLPSLQHVSGC